MATKSRLGKGLGALFPALPGESQKHEDVVQEPQAAAEKPRKKLQVDGMQCPPLP